MEPSRQREGLYSTYIEKLLQSTPAFLMTNINVRKRAAHKRRIQVVLQEILNDPDIMPNVDCRDLLVSIRRIEFGKTVREIYVDFFGWSRYTLSSGEESLHQKYMREAWERGEHTYVDLTDVAYYREYMHIVEIELQRRMGLLYTPTLRHIHSSGW